MSETSSSTRAFKHSFRLAARCSLAEGQGVITKRNIWEARDWFEVLQSTTRTQTAMMTLAPGQASSSKAEGHRDCDQVLLVLEGEVEGKIDGQTAELARGDVVVIPGGTKHKFVNRGSVRAVTFNTYSPPEYAADEIE